MTSSKESLKFHQRLKVLFVVVFATKYEHKSILEYQWNNTLRSVRIHFDTPTFDRITKDSAAKFVDKLSAIGGTMGLLTGFSIISGVEILYFAFKLVLSLVSFKKKSQGRRKCIN